MAQTLQFPEKRPDSNGHYHIRWSSNSSLDWEPFATKDEAMEMAGRMKRRKESYVIVERDDECERCTAFKSEAFEQGKLLTKRRFERFL